MERLRIKANRGKHGGTLKKKKKISERCERNSCNATKGKIRD